MQLSDYRKRQSFPTLAEAIPRCWSVACPLLVQGFAYLSFLPVAHPQVEFPSSFSNVEEFKALVPDYAMLATIKVSAVIITVKSHTDGIDFLSRYFSPREGIFEDPATGSSFCVLGPYWASKLKGSTSDPVALHGYQVSVRCAMHLL